MRDCGQQLKKCGLVDNSRSATDSSRSFEEVLNHYPAQKLIEKAPYGRNECYRYAMTVIIVKKPSGRNQLTCCVGHYGPLWVTTGHYGPLATMGHYWRCEAVKQPWLGDVKQSSNLGLAMCSSQATLAWR
jgi:hypothetical protein